MMFVNQNNSIYRPGTILWSTSSTEGPAEGSTEGPAEGSTEGPAEGPAEGSTEGSTEGSIEGSGAVEQVTHL